jgi:hypothetical protein
MVVTGAEYEDIYNWLQPVLAASLENPGFSRPRLNYEPNAPRLLVDVDPEKAAALGVSSQAVGRTLETMFGSRRVTRDFDFVVARPGTRLKAVVAALYDQGLQLAARVNEAGDITATIDNQTPMTGPTRVPKRIILTVFWLAKTDKKVALDFPMTMVRNQMHTTAANIRITTPECGEKSPTRPFFARVNPAA